MKALTPIALGILLLVTPRAGAQRTITMANYGVDPSGQAWSAPIFLPDGVTPATAPYGVSLLEGNTVSSLSPVPGSTTLLGPGGLFSGPTLTISGVSAGTFVEAEILVWNSSRRLLRKRWLAL